VSFLEKYHPTGTSYPLQRKAPFLGEPLLNHLRHFVAIHPRGLPEMLVRQPLGFLLQLFFLTKIRQKSRDNLLGCLFLARAQLDLAFFA
jgi:hypothetical protein